MPVEAGVEVLVGVGGAFKAVGRRNGDGESRMEGEGVGGIGETMVPPAVQADRARMAKSHITNNGSFFIVYLIIQLHLPDRFQQRATLFEA